jgi:hypothetical protein
MKAFCTALDIIFALNARTGSHSQVLQHGVFLCQQLNGSSNRFGILRLNKKSGVFMRYRASESAHVAGDYRTPACHGFQHNVRQTVTVASLIDNGGRNQNMGASVSFRQIIMRLGAA